MRSLSKASLALPVAIVLIQRIQDREIRGLKSYRKAMKAVAEQQPERVVMVVLRGVETHFQYLEPDWKPHTDEDDKNQGNQAGEE